MSSHPHKDDRQRTREQIVCDIGFNVVAPREGLPEPGRPDMMQLPVEERDDVRAAKFFLWALVWIGVGAAIYATGWIVVRGGGRLAGWW